jgi:ParB family chromosome partitioning protein
MRIRPNPNQPRRSFKEEELEELAQSIREHGILQPLLVKADSNGEFELVSGERRLRAAELAGLTKVPAIMVDPGKPAGSLTIALVENVQRTDLNAVELARAYKRLHEEFGRTQEEIAKTVGKSRPHVANMLRLLELPERIQEAISEGKITAGHAKALLMAPVDVRLIIYERIIKRDLNVRQAEKAARRAPDTGGVVSTDTIPVGESEDVTLRAMIHDMEMAMESSLGRKVTIQRGNGGAGKVSIEFYEDKDLESLVERLIRKI